MGYQRRVHGDSSGDSPLVSTHRLELTLDGQYWIGKDASRPVHTKRWPHPQGKVLVQLCLSIEGIPGPPCPPRRGCFTRFTPALSKLCQRLSQTSSTSSPSWSPRCSTGQSAPASSP